MRFNPRTLNGRFILIASIFLTILLCLSFYSFYIVQQISDENFSKIHVNNKLSESIHHLIEELQHLESGLHQYASLLSREKKNQVLGYLEDLRLLSGKLSGTREVQENPVLAEHTTRLSKHVIRLGDLVNKYVEIMENVDSRYPGMPILMEHLEPNNRKFSEAVEQALQEGELTTTRPTVIKSDQFKIMQLFQEARYAWSMQVSWFRVFVANRMGAFGDPEQAMRNNLNNRKLFVDNLESILIKLDYYNKKGMLGIQQEESLRTMREALMSYTHHFDRAVEIYFSENWRSDVALMRDSLQPMLDKAMESAEAIEEVIYTSNEQALDDTQKTAVLLSIFIFLFSAIMMLMLFIAYHVFQKNIRGPVLKLANRMQSESLYSPGTQTGGINVEEIQRLIESYDDMRNQVSNRQQRLESILASAAEGIITFNKDGIIETFNAAAQKLFDYRESEIIGESITALLPDNDSPFNNPSSTSHVVKTLIENNGGRQEMHGKRSNGIEFIMSLKISEMVIDNKPLYTAIVDDITERHAMMDHLRHMAEHDALTGLYNRQFFNTALEREFARAKRSKQNCCACLYLDLDNFKYVNDTLGHQEGDRLLVGISKTLSSRTRKADILARLGGDEFALILTDIEPDNVMQVANTYREAISKYAFLTEGKQVNTGCSIGVAIYEDEVENMEGLLARADLACHMAKRSGRNRVYLFEDNDKDRIDSFYEEIGWSSRIKHALENNGFVFSCQPILSVNNRSIYSHELLLRMKDPETGEYILPGGFFDSAERFGLMPEIDRWVIKNAFEWLNQQPEHDGLKYFINLSGKSIGDVQFLDYIRDSLSRLTMDPSRIVFEITENVAISNLDNAAQFIAELKKMGFNTALDDFGVGYSSFSYLRELNVDYVKIDGSFIDSMHKDELNLALVKAINDVCHILGKQTIAEFVQNEDALDLLNKIGVDFAQGYNIAVASDYGQETIQFRIA